MGVMKSLRGVLAGETPGDDPETGTGARDMENVLKALTYGDVDDRLNAIRAVGELGESFLVPLVKALEDEYWIIRRGASDTLAKIGPAAIVPLIGILRSENPDTQRETQRALVLIGEPAVEQLVRAMQDENKYVRRSAIEILGIMRVPQAVPGIIAALTDEDPLVRQQAAITLRNYSQPDSVNSLIRLLKDENGYVRMAAVETLCVIGLPSIEPLIAALAENDAELQQRASLALTSIGPPSVEYLISGLENENTGIKRCCAYILGRICDTRAIPALVLLLGDPDRDVRREAVAALAGMEDDSVPALARAFHDGDQVVRNSAMEALWRIGPRATRPVVDMLSDPKSDIRKRAALLLGEIGDISSVEPLARVLTDDSPGVRREVFEAIEMIKIRSGYSRPVQEIKSGEGDYPQNEDRVKKSSW